MLKKSIKKSAFRPAVRSRHPSHAILRTHLPTLPFRSVIRLGSTTDLQDTVSNGGKRIECNTIQSIKNASNKLLMKRCFTAGDVKTADWYIINNVAAGYRAFIDNNKESSIPLSELPYPIIAKHIYGSRNKGNTKLDNLEQLENWLKSKSSVLTSYIFERFYNYTREYRLHVDAEGYFYTCRKMIKSDTPEDKRWFKNDSNCVWMLEENPSFDKPSNWDDIVEQCVRALNSVGLDVGGCDVRIQSRTNSNGEVREFPEFIILEINSACSLGEVTAQKYIKQLPIILKNKYDSLNG